MPRYKDYSYEQHKFIPVSSSVAAVVGCGLSPHKFMPMSGVHQALQRTRPSRSGCNRTPLWAGSLSLGRSAARFRLVNLHKTETAPSLSPWGMCDEW